MLQHDLIVVRNEFIRIVPETHQWETYVLHYKQEEVPENKNHKYKKSEYCCNMERKHTIKSYAIIS